MSLGNSCIERVRYRLTALSMLTVTVVVLKRSQLHKKAYNLSLEAYCVMLTRFERAEGLSCSVTCLYIAVLAVSCFFM